MYVYSYVSSNSNENNTSLTRERRLDSYEKPTLIASWLHMSLLSTALKFQSEQLLSGMGQLPQ